MILAKDLFKDVIRHHCEEVSSFPGSDLIGRSYKPLFPGAVDRGESETAWTVIGADWVTTTDGTGVVHTAVMYGEDDYNLGMEVGLPAQHTVGMDGSFLTGIHPELDGRYVKDCDETVIKLLHDSTSFVSRKDVCPRLSSLLAHWPPIAILCNGLMVRPNDCRQGYVT